MTMSPQTAKGPLLPPQTWDRVRTFIEGNPSAQVIFNCVAGRIASVEYHHREPVPELRAER